MKRYLFVFLLSMLVSSSSIFIYGETYQEPQGQEYLNRRNKKAAVSPRMYLPVLSDSPDFQKAYGLLIYDDVDYNRGLVSFNLQNATHFDPYYYFGADDVSAGAYAGGKYYIAGSGVDDSKEYPTNLLEFDINTKTNRIVGALTGLENVINDMSYDYSTGIMYCIAKQGSGVSALYTINLTSATIVRVALLDRYFYTLACSYGGQLYGISRNGEFCKINKTDGDVQKVGDTGFSPSYYQTMEFDHSDKTLYWATYTMAEESFISTIDLKTGIASKVGSLGNNGELVGLYIPFEAAPDNAPGKIIDLEVTPDKLGEAKVTLKWTHPWYTFTNELLNDLTQIEIYRNGELIQTITNPIPGNTAEYIDYPATLLNTEVSYKLVPVNTFGKGIANEQTVYVGPNQPGAPENPTMVRRSPNQVELSWNTPISGLHGTHYDKTSLSYNILRLPDNVLVANQLKDSVYIDTVTGAVNTYQYRITAYNQVGEGGAYTTTKLVLGPLNEYPYFCDFIDESPFKTWTLVNANGDQNTWTRTFFSTLNKYAVAYPFSAVNAADEWLISHAMNFEAGMTYEVRFKINCQKPNNLRFTIGEDATVATQTKEIGVFTNMSHTPFTQKNFTFVAESTGPKSIGMHLYSDANSGHCYLTDFEVVPIVPIDMAIVSMEGNRTPIAEKQYTYKFNVKNAGTEAVSKFTVGISNEDNKQVLVSEEINHTLQPEETGSFDIKWSPELAGQFLIRAFVRCEGDPVSGNDKTAAEEMTVQPVGSAERITIGTISKYESMQPYAFYYKNSAALNIYTADELDVKGGVIETIIYPYNNKSGKAINDSPVKVFLAHTDRQNTVAGWLPEEELILVYEGNVTIPQGLGELTIPLDRYFQYEGGNLAVMTTRSVTSGYYSNMTFACYTGSDSSNKGYIYGSDSQPYTPQVSGAQSSAKSNIIIKILGDGASVSGKVTDNNSKPVANAQVTLTERKMIVLTDAEGNYKFDYIPNGTYSIVCESENYKMTRVENITVADKKNVECNITVVKIGEFTITGQLVNYLDLPVADVELIISGVEQDDIVMQQTGVFTVTVKEGEYNLAFNKTGYKSVSRNCIIQDRNIYLGKIRLDYLIGRAANPDCVLTDEAVVRINWDKPATAHLFRRDNGEQAAHIGINHPKGQAIIGVVNRTPAFVTEATWKTSWESGPHFLLKLFLFDLDESGNPTNTILYQADVSNRDQEWSTHVLSTPVLAPRGYLVALSYPGYIALALDNAADPVYPFENKQVVTGVDYEVNEFEYLEDLDIIKGNPLIRTKALLMPDNGQQYPGVNEEEISLSYKVWRVMASDSDNQDNWTLLTSTPIKNTMFDDLSSDELSSGVYRYAVSTVYPDGSESTPTLTKRYVVTIGNGAEAILAEEDVLIYPNPSTDYIKVKGDYSSLKIMDMNGRLVRQIDNKSDQIDVRGLSEGIYMIVITNATSQTVKIEKLTIRR
ncbi:MAG: carboxypeptidase regulatory-like domain-containing protein [Bacteroidales bacterium]